ncbi:hypothetical protein HAV29_20325, partial [Elizabethkingia miricola]|nr:hypothetical protein [Elizabethkingia miricola]
VDLITNSFFVEDKIEHKLLMGEFVKKTINTIINWLNNDERLAENQEEYKKIIELIDEPLLKNKLKEMYYNIFPEELDKELEIRKIKARAKELGLKFE